MIRWQWVKQFPKWAIVVVVLFGSTGLFGLRWWLRSKKVPQHVTQGTASEVQASAPDRRAESLPDRVDRLFLADGDLYDSENGELIFKNWLRGSKPAFIYYQEDQKKFIGHFERGFERYNLDGTKEETLTTRYGIVVSSDLEQAVYARERDMWIAEIDWPGFKLTKERPITKLGNLPEPNMIQNTLLGSKKFILLRHRNDVLRLNLSTGESTKSRFGAGDIRPQGRSLDGSMLMGQEAGKKLFAYDLDTDTAATVPLQTQVTGILWLKNNDGFALVGEKDVYAYSKSKNAFTKICSLPSPALKLENASPDGRFVFAQGKNTVQLVDGKEKKTTPFEQIGQKTEWISDDTLLMSNEVPDSKLRGTWVQIVGQPAQRLIGDPYLVNRDGSALFLRMPSAKEIVMASRDRLFKATSDGANLKELGTLVRPVSKIQSIGTLPLHN
jgi:hypothetical protein